MTDDAAAVEGNKITSDLLSIWMYVSVCLLVRLLVCVVMCQSKMFLYLTTDFDGADIVKFSRYQKHFNSSVHLA